MNKVMPKHVIKQSLAFCMATLALLAPMGGGLTGYLSKSASATSSSARTKVGADIDAVISISAPPSGNLTESGSGDAPITPTPEGTTATYSEDVIVSTNNLTGYTLHMSMLDSAENNRLNSVLDPNNYSIPSITAEVATINDLDSNTWGYNVPLRDGDKYKPLPTKTSSTTPSEQHELRTTDHMVAEEQTQVNFATKVDTNQASGQYNNTVLYTATANNPPTPQAKAVLCSNGRLDFIYDALHYNEGEPCPTDGTTNNTTNNTNPNADTIKEVFDAEHDKPVPYKSTGSADVPWAGHQDPTTEEWDYRPDITSANFAPSFSNYPVASTRSWFENDRYISSITNVANLQATAIDNVPMISMFSSTGYEVTGDFSIDLTGFDTSHANNMQQMFDRAGYKASNFSLTGLDNWDTSNVTNMLSMFGRGGYTTTGEVSLNLSNWDTSNVTTMRSMFSSLGQNASTWSIGDLSRWNTSNVTNMNSMFSSTGSKTQTWSIGNLDNWNTSKVRSMSFMFDGAGYYASDFNLGNLSNWDTSKVENMSYMFRNTFKQAPTWSIPGIENWDTSNVTDMSGMFGSSSNNQPIYNKVLDLSRWNVSKVTSMDGMFGISGFNPSHLTVGDISHWDTRSLQNVSSMFKSTNFNQPDVDLSGWNTSNLTSMSGMFAQSNITTLDISGWDTSNVTNMGSMFSNANSITKVYVGTGWNTSKIAPETVMFHTGNDLEGGKGTKLQTVRYQDLDYWDTVKYARIDEGPDSEHPGYFTNKNDPGPPPSPTPVPENNTNNVFNTYNTTNNNSNNTDQGNSTDSYSNPQGVSSSKNIIPGTSNPNWFLFILLLTLSILTLGISLSLFLRKRKQQKDSTEI